jgi:sugar lactone lactonase YvrE/DNA-binding IclR family transcriptional regulator
MEPKIDPVRSDILDKASADMARLVEVTGEAVVLALIAENEAVYVDKIDPHHLSNERPRIGQRVPLWRTAIGKALAASLPIVARQSLLDGMNNGQLTGSGFTNRQALRAHLDLVHARGYAIEVDELIPGISAVAAPIVDHRGQPVAVIGIEGPSERLPREKLHELGPAVVEATRSASLHAGGAPRPTSKSPRPSASPSPSVRLLVDTRNLIGEAPVYDAANDRLFWVDMYDPAIFRFDCKSRKLISFYPGEMVTALALVPEGMLVAAQSGLWLADPDTGDLVRSLGHPESHIPSNRFNDGKCDSRNRFWVNTVDLNFARNAGALYRMEPDSSFKTMETGLTVPNGMGWSPDNKTMYLADTADRTIYAYDFCEESGDISNRRVLVRIPDGALGAPDGLAIDQNGTIWVAMFDGWRISQFSATGALINEIVLPVPRPTSCTLGGQNNRTLYVTSARIRVSEAALKEAPHSGAVFEVAL